MKTKFLVIIILISFTFISSAQLNPIKIIFKNGDTLTGLGNIKSETINYNKYKNSETIEYPFSDIKYIETRVYEDTTIIKINFFKLRSKDKYVGVQEEYIGKKIELYAINSGGYSPGFIIGVNGTNGLGIGINIGGGSGNSYYIKKPEDETVLSLGNDNLLGNLKENVFDYFSDCQLILDKINNKELNVRKHLKEIVRLYDVLCKPK